MKTQFMQAAMVLASVLTTQSVVAESVNFSYSQGDVSYIGTGKAEKVDVAIRVVDPGLVGSGLTGFSVPLPDGVDISDVTVWLSKSLTLEVENGTKVNKPDIAEWSVTPSDNQINLVFPQVYTMTANGVYVGYSFTINNSEDSPIAVTTCADDAKEKAFWLHSAKSYRSWYNLASTTGNASAITIAFESDIHENSIGIAGDQEYYVKVGDVSSLPITLINHGTNAAQSIDYTCTIDGTSTSYHKELTTTIPAQFGITANEYITIPAIPEKGLKQVGIVIDKVNGEDNPDAGRQITLPVNVLSMVPVHRTIMEEYTGTWCGWCLRGIAAIEKLKALYPETFLSAAWHYDDIMAITTVESPGSYPYCILDRSIGCDPYMGSSKTDFGIEADFISLQKKFSPADLSVSADWSDDGQTILNVSASTTFVKDVADTYKMEYLLLADGLHDEDGNNRRWWQHNYFYNKDPQTYPEDLRGYCSEPEYVQDISYPDVIVLSSVLNGDESETIENITVDNPITTTYSFDTTKAIGVKYDTYLIQDKSKLKVIAILVNKTNGTIVNAAEFAFSGTTGSAMINENNLEVRDIKFYDIAGRSVQYPQNGLFVKVVTYSTGQTATSKVVLK